MKDILEILKSYGLEVPSDKAEAFKKEFVENYKAVAELEKKTTKIVALEEDKKALEEQLKTANETIAGFEGADVEGLKQQIADYNQKLKDTEEQHKREIEQRDFKDALTEAMKEVEFTSEYARKSVMAEIEAAGLKLIDGKIIGLNDLLETIKEKDKAAFVDKEQEQLEQGKAKFTTPLNIKEGTKLSTSELMKLKNQYPNLDITKYM